MQQLSPPSRTPPPTVGDVEVVLELDEVLALVDDPADSAAPSSSARPSTAPVGASDTSAPLLGPVERGGEVPPVGASQAAGVAPPVPETRPEIIAAGAAPHDITHLRKKPPGTGAHAGASSPSKLDVDAPFDTLERLVPLTKAEMQEVKRMYSENYHESNTLLVENLQRKSWPGLKLTLAEFIVNFARAHPAIAFAVDRKIREMLQKKKVRKYPVSLSTPCRPLHGCISFSLIKLVGYCSTILHSLCLTGHP